MREEHRGRSRLSGFILNRIIKGLIEERERGGESGGRGMGTYFTHGEEVVLRGPTLELRRDDARNIALSKKSKT